MPTSHGGPNKRECETKFPRALRVAFYLLVRASRTLAVRRRPAAFEHAPLLFEQAYCSVEHSMQVHLPLRA